MSDDVTDLRSLLLRPGSDFPDLPNLPAKKSFYGKIIAMTSGHSSAKKTPFFDFALRITDPGKDVPPEWLKQISEAGFSLSDFNISAKFYLTPGAMKMLRRFEETIGLDPNKNFFENFALDTETGNPTQESQERVRGKDVLFVTQDAENGVVYTTNVYSIDGVKR